MTKEREKGQKRNILLKDKNLDFFPPTQASYLATLQDNSISRLSLLLELLQVLQNSPFWVVCTSMFSGRFMSEKPSMLIAINTVVLSSQKVLLS